MFIWICNQYICLNADLDKYTGYGIGFDSHGECSLPDGRIGKNVIIFKWIWLHLCILVVQENIS